MYLKYVYLLKLLALWRLILSIPNISLNKKCRHCLLCSLVTKQKEARVIDVAFPVGWVIDFPRHVILCKFYAEFGN